MYYRLTSILLAGSLTALGGQSGAPAQDSAPWSQDWGTNPLSNLSLDPVGPGDLIEIYVADYPEITRSYRLSVGGTIELPVLKQPLNLSHMTSTEMGKAVAEALSKGGLLVDPVVSVSVLEYRSRPVTVAGAVHQPITLQAIGGLRILDAISKASGLAPEAGPDILVSRPALDGQAEYERRIPVKELMASSDSALNILLQGGEDIRVPAAEKLYIVGNVKNPGAYPLDPNGSLTVLQAIALCQGTLGFSKAEAVVYRTTSGTAGRTEINIDLKLILKRRAKDVELRPNDILYIPERTGQRLAATVLDRLANFGATTTSGLIIWGSK